MENLNSLHTSLLETLRFTLQKQATSSTLLLAIKVQFKRGRTGLEETKKGGYFADK